MIHPTFNPQKVEELTGRYIVTFQKSAVREGMSLLRDQAGLEHIVSSADYSDHELNVNEISEVDGAIFEELEVCVVNCLGEDASRIQKLAQRSAVMAIEPEHRVFTLASSTHQEHSASAEHLPFFDSTNETWGYQSVGISKTRYNGTGVRACVLDTGIDGTHPDFQNVRFGGIRSFVSESAEDTNGHGTHCAGTICGPRMPHDAPGYGIAPDAEMLIGKVLSNDGVGDDRSVLAGLNWAVANRCNVVSLSLGTSNYTPSQAFEQVGIRALDAGTLIVAAAGNDSDRSSGKIQGVVRPANNRSIMAVGAIDHHHAVADFSARSSKVAGGEVDIVAPGVEVFSAWPRPERYRGATGTSMAVPFVSGIAALYAEAYGIRGWELWERILRDATPLPLASVDVGAGLVQAPP